ncbi:FAD-binding protein [Candidatus Bathyarchaeota archaeon]|nr:FAD-binding protein [Candidatus Bathyarchaeota archaeon]
MKQLSTDVLIIGSGGAGLRAAIEARRQGVNVLLVSKGKLGLANCTAIAGGVFRASQNKKGITEHFQETLEAGRFLNNPNLVRTLAADAWLAVKETEKFGIELSAEKGKVSIVADKPPAGANLSKALGKCALDFGVNVSEKTSAFDLLVEDNRCIGALAFKKDVEGIIVISAKSTVVATGGYSGLYVRNDNPPRTTGDGVVLAFEAGAELQDLEFVQFQQMFTDRGVPRMPVLDCLTEGTKNLVPGGPLMSKKGERFLGKHGLLENRILRDNLTVSIERELYEEHEDSVLFDLTQLSPREIVDALNYDYQKHLVLPLGQILSTRRLHLASFAHYTMGGIKINEKCETRVDALYAVGEVTSGIHGANRVGGNALTEILVFGAITGRQAADHAKRTESVAVNKEQIKERTEKLQEICDNSKPRKTRPLRIKAEVSTVVSEFCRPVRSEEGLKCALEELKRIEERASFMFAENPDKLQDAIEANSMLLLAKLVANSALTRKESRGAHFRVDYPKSDDTDWLKNIIISQQNGKTQIRYEHLIGKQI